MRDLVILAILGVMVIWALRQPWVGAMAWTGVSLGSPHSEFGYAAAGWPVGTVFAAATLLGLLWAKPKQNPMVGSGSAWMLAFTVWITITLPFSIFFDLSYPLWERSMKIFLMLYVTMALITDRRKLDVFIWVNVVAIGFYGVKGGVFTIASGGNFRVWGPGGFIEGNNEVAVAVLSVIPLMRYLQLQSQRTWAKHAFSGSMLLCVATALGTHSRGALLALGCMALYFWWKSKSKLLWGVVMVAAGVVGLSAMPDHWWERMNTIKTYDADASAMGRINAWWMAFNLAKDRLFGGGFTIWTGVVFQKYAPIPDDPHAAHSIYFQVLGEHGFIGLAIYLMVGVATWWVAMRLIRLARLQANLSWAGDLGAMVQVSMIAFAVGGAFLSLAYFDLPYNVMAITMLAYKFAVAERSAAAQNPAQTPGRAGGLATVRPAGTETT